jgi:hypothetical protein
LVQLLDLSKRVGRSCSARDGRDKSERYNGVTNGSKGKEFHPFIHTRILFAAGDQELTPSRRPIRNLQLLIAGPAGRHGHSRTTRRDSRTKCRMPGTPPWSPNRRVAFKKVARPFLQDFERRSTRSEPKS